jgi:hypothetical protein
MAKLSDDEAAYMQRMGAFMKKQRVKKGYTSSELFAYDNDINRTQYFRYEKGEDFRFSSFLKVVKGFDMTPAQFLTEFENEQGKAPVKKPKKAK